MIYSRASLPNRLTDASRVATCIVLEDRALRDKFSPRLSGERVTSGLENDSGWIMPLDNAIFLSAGQKYCFHRARFLRVPDISSVSFLTRDGDIVE